MSKKLVNNVPVTIVPLFDRSQVFRHSISNVPENVIVLTIWIHMKIKWLKPII